VEGEDQWPWSSARFRQTAKNDRPRHVSER
jgi:hypothetical protein